MNLTKLAKAGCVLVLCIISSIYSYAQPSANFTATPTSGCAPLLVTFSDQSTGNPTSWRWEFGDGTIGNTSTNQNPSRIYYNPGQYTVKLVVQNASGTDSIVRVQYINVYAKPVVDFAASAYMGCPPLITNLTDLSTPGSGTIATWNWDFGNGTSSNLPNPTANYYTTGIYSISLVVTNSHGCSNSLTKDTIIRITNKPQANFTTGSTANCGAPLTVSFNNQSTGTGNLTYLWVFGDGFTSTELNPSHTYNTTGSFSPQLIVYNQGGCADTIIRLNAINIANHLTMFTIPTSVCTNSNLTITNTTTPAPVNTRWSFGDGTTSNAFSPTKTYTTSGTYQITMVNNYGACIDSMTRTITVLDQPTTSFTASPRASCYAPLTVSFTNTSTNAVSYLWNFGDNGTSTLPNPVHTYLTPGDRTVTLTVTSASGCSITYTRNQYISIHLPVVSVNQLPQKGCAPFEWTFQHTQISGDSIVGYNWNFGDGSSSTLQSPTHVFDSGSYTIVLTIITVSGCTDTITYINGIKAGTRPQAQFSATPRNTCAQLPVAFSDLSTPVGVNIITQWSWDFGDGGTSVLQNPQHIYTDTGYFPVQLIAYNNGCPDTLIVPDYIHINPPIAKFNVIQTCSNRMNVSFIDSSIGADTWLWNFGDGSTSTAQNPSHIYSLSGPYVVTLTVHNNLTGCDHVATRNILAINQRPSISASDTVICKGGSVTFSANVTNTLFNSIKWNFGDNSTGNGSPITKIYYNAGIYSIRVITNNKNGCIDTVFKPRYITVNGPTANFTTINANVCSYGNVIFNDSSYSDGRNGLSKWIWNYGDGHIDTTIIRAANHIYTTGGNYTVTLTVLDSSGCSNTKIKSNIITAFHPTASFSTYDSVSCPAHNITFNNTSTGSGLTYLWYFGDGRTDNSPNPSHSYTSNGTYTVRLIVIDQNGCKDTAIRTNLIRIVTPVANFTLSDSVGACPPLIVNFTNTSLNATSLLWDFGDNGNTSVETAPSHIYNISGTFRAVLTVTGPGGCIATKQKNIIVHGPRGTFTYGGLSGCVPMTVNFHASAVSTDSYVWDFSDGSTNISLDSAKSHVYTTTGAFLPKVILRDTAGCIVPIMGRDTIRVYDITSGFNFNSQAFCNQGSVSFNNTTTAADVITGYSWNFGDGSALSTATNPSHTYVGSGLYQPQLIATSAHGCKDTLTSSVPVRVVANPSGLIDQTGNGCVNLSVRFNGRLALPDTSSLTWDWNFGNGSTSNVMNPSSQLYNNAGSYPVRLLITNSSGCKDTVTSTVEAYALPNIDAGIDTMICKGRGIAITATGGDRYSWSPSTGLSCNNCASPVANPASATLYFVTGTSIHGCVNRDSVKVNVKYPFTMSASRKDSLCVGSSLRLNASGASTYVWSPSTGLDNPTAASPMATPDSTITYQVIGTDDRNCFKDTSYVPVVVFKRPTVEAGPDRTLNVGSTLDLMPQVSSDVIDARWSPTNSIFRDVFPGITIRPIITTTYTVVVKNSGGCTASDQLTIHVLCNNANMFIPNTFSPNGDGMNDVFYPRGSGIFTIKNIKIFSRWGEVVFERSNFNANDVSKAWDGTYKGKKLNSDVFVYALEVICEDNQVLTFKGNVALIK